MWGLRSCGTNTLTEYYTVSTEVWTHEEITSGRWSQRHRGYIADCQSNKKDRNDRMDIKAISGIEQFLTSRQPPQKPQDTYLLLLTLDTNTPSRNPLVYKWYRSQEVFSLRYPQCHYFHQFSSFSLLSPKCPCSFTQILTDFFHHFLILSYLLSFLYLIFFSHFGQDGRTRTTIYLDYLGSYPLTHKMITELSTWCRTPWESLHPAPCQLQLHLLNPCKCPHTKGLPLPKSPQMA